jgi:hypothetical protein
VSPVDERRIHVQQQRDQRQLRETWGACGTTRTRLPIRTRWQRLQPQSATSGGGICLSKIRTTPGLPCSRATAFRQCRHRRGRHLRRDQDDAGDLAVHSERQPGGPRRLASTCSMGRVIAELDPVGQPGLRRRSADPRAQGRSQ